MQVPLPQQPDRPQGPRPLGRGVGGVVRQDAANVQGQQLSQAFGKLGEGLTEIGAQMNEDHAIATAKSGLNEWYGTADEIVAQQTSKVGKAAMTVNGQVVAAGAVSKHTTNLIEDQLRSVEDRLPTEMAKRIFRTYAERGLSSMRGKLYRHELQQIKVHEHGENVAGLARYTDTYARDGDGAMFQAALETAREIASGAGLGKNQRAELLLQTRTALHAGRVDQLLTVHQDPKGADAYLRSQEKDEIDVKVRQKLRAQINTALKSQVARKLGVDLVANQGYRTRQDWVAAAASELPQARQDQIAKTAVTQIARELGVSQDDLEVPGAWRMLLSSPEVMARLPDKILTLDQEIIRARYPDQPSAMDPSTGTYRRAMETLERMYKAGEITAEQLQMAQSTVDTQIGRAVKVRAVEADETLQAIRETGLSVDSPDLPSELRERAIELGVLSQARAMTQRQTNEVMYDKAWADFTQGRFAKMSAEEVRVTYKDHLSTVHWREVFGLWSKSQPDGGSGGGKIEGGLMKWHELARYHWGMRGLITGDPDSNSIPTVNTKNPKDPDEPRRWRDMIFALNLAVGSDKWTAEQFTQWLDERERREVTIDKDDDLSWWMFASLPTAAIWWGEKLFAADSEKTTFEALEAEKRAAAATRDPDLIKAARDRSGSTTIKMQDGTTVRADRFKVYGPPDDPIPPKASEYMRDWFRLSVLQLNVPRPQYQAIHQVLDAYGATDPNKQIDAETRTEIEKVFQKAGLDIHPPLEGQWMWWKANRDQEPWRTLAPRNPKPEKGRYMLGVVPGWAPDMERPK